MTLIARPSLLVRSAGAVEWMIRIDRIAVDANIAAIAAQLDLPFCRVVTWLAQTLQLASDKVGPITSMQRDMIDHVRRRHDSALQTELTQRVLHQLQFAQPLPARSFIEAIPCNRITTKGRHRRHLHRREWAGSSRRVLECCIDAASTAPSSRNCWNSSRNSSGAPNLPFDSDGTAR